MKKRNPLIALFLSLCAPGLGQIYNGQIRRGFTFLGVCIGLALLYYCWLGRTFIGLMIIFSTIITFAIYIYIDSIIGARKVGSIQLTSWNSTLFYVFYTFVIITLLTLGKANSPIKLYSIPTSSMIPTVLRGDYIQAIRGNNDIHRGDIVVHRNSRDRNVSYIKRVIGLPGDTIETKNGLLIVNQQTVIQSDVSLDQTDYLDSKSDYIAKSETLDDTTYNVFTSPKFQKDEIAPIVLNETQYYLVGDNRPNSGDSRIWGPINKDDIIGKVNFVYFSKGPDFQIRTNRMGKKL